MDVIDVLVVKKLSLLSALPHLIKGELKIEFTSLFVLDNIDDTTLHNILPSFKNGYNIFGIFFHGSSLRVSPMDNWPPKASVANVLSTSIVPYCPKNFWYSTNVGTRNIYIPYTEMVMWRQHTISLFPLITFNIWTGLSLPDMSKTHSCFFHLGQWSKATPLGQTTCRNAVSNVTLLHLCSPTTIIYSTVWSSS